MPIRRAATWISTIVVAIAVALAVPVSQLRTIAIFKTCCCPDPTDCHCPDDHSKGDPQSQPSMRACHSSQQVIVAPQAPALHAPVVAIAAVPAITAPAAVPSIPAPHPAPPPARPDAPS